MTQTAKVVTRLFKRKKERKLRIDVEKMGWILKSKGMLSVISQGILDTDEELCACFIDWQKAFDSLNRPD